MKDKLRFENLDVRRFPGFEKTRGFSIDDLSPGINVIYGPNGSGKTTIARAIQALIWPGEAPESCNVKGGFVLDGDDWTVENDSGRAYYSRNGRETDGIGSKLPPPDQRNRYYLALHELLSKETDNRAFAEIIVRESAGGYDLSEVERGHDFRSRPSNAGRSTDRRAKRKLEKVSEIEDRVSKLQRESKSLKNLRGKLREAREAEDRVVFFENLVDYRRKARRLKNLENRLDSFPDPVEKLNGSEDERLEELNERINKLERRKEETLDKIEKANDTLAEVDLEGDDPDQALLEELEEKTDRLESFEKELEEINDAIAEKEQLKDAIFTGQAEEIANVEIRNMDIGAIDDMVEFAREAEEIRSRLSAYRQISDWLNNEEEVRYDPEYIREGRRLLEEWLRRKRTRTDSPLSVWVGRGLGSLGLVTTLTLALTVNPLFLLLLIPAGGLLWLIWHKGGSSVGGSEIKNRYLELDLDAPSDWAEGSVRQLIHALSRKEAEAVLARKKEDFLKSKDDEIKSLKKRKAELEKTKEKLVERYGVAPDIDEAKFYWLVERLNRWKKVVEELEGLKGRRRAIKGRISELRDELTSGLNSYGYSISNGSTEIRGCLRDLRRRKERFARARDRLTEAKSRKKDLVERLGNLRNQKSSLYEDLGLEEGDRSGLNDCLKQLEDFQSVHSEYRKQRAVCTSALEDLRERKQFDEDHLERDVSELRSELEDCRKKARKKEALFEEINRIEERIEITKKENELEMARAELDRALGKLKDQLYSDYGSLAGNVLLNYLREQGLGRDRPKVLKRGGELFTRITKGEYRLELAGDSPPSFKAIDTVSGDLRSLDHLSSGTRLQLLMAVRMGFVEAQETEIKLPLFLDEVLANSDDLKATEIIDVGLEFCREGRQIFYLTAQGDEVAKWRTKLEEAPGIPSRFIDLSGVRDLDETINVPEASNFESTHSPPEPDGMDHRKYGDKLSVPKYDPVRGPGSAHLWYLVEDVDLLYRLLRLGVETWGQLKALSEDNATVLSGFDEESLGRVKRLGRVLERYTRARLVGRNRPIDRGVLEKSGAVTENFIDEVTELLRESEGDPELLIRRLEEGFVSGFRTRKRKELENYLLEEGYISREDELSNAEIKARLLSSIESTELSNTTRAVSRLLERLTRYGNTK